MLSTYLLLHLHARTHGLDTIATLDDIGLERDWSRAAVQLEEQAAGIAEDGARFIASPERGGGSLTVLAGGLCCLLVIVSRHGSHLGSIVAAKRRSKGIEKMKVGKAGEV